MRFKRLIAVVGCIGTVALWFVLRSVDGPETSQTGYTIPRHVRYSFTLWNTTNQVVKDAAFWTYAPVKQTAAQKCVNVYTSPPARLIIDELGNQILEFTFEALPPYATKLLTVDADLLLSVTPNRLPTDHSFLEAEDYCEAQDSEILGLASRLKEDTAGQTANNIFGWVSGNISFAGYLKNVRGALYALKHKSGDCTEFMYLFAALCRANRIPCRAMGGYVCEANAMLEPNEYHNWAEFREDGTWKIADPQRKVLRGNPSHYIAMQVIGTSSRNPMEGHSRFRLVGNGIKAKMNG